MNISIIFEDEDILVVNKPSGISVHSDGRTKDRVLTDWVLEEFPKIENVGEPLILQGGEKVNRPGIVHRLDKETSGVLVLAKKQDAYLHLKQQFREREIKKIYNTFVYDILKNSRGEIDKQIGRSKKDFRLRSVDGSGSLREAFTEYKVLQRGSNCSYLEVYPKTGRTHQIRIHLKSIGHPIICDKLYAPKRECLLGFKRLALHARELRVKNVSNETLILEAPFPDDFEDALREIAS